jgi:2-polyprenyl-3-methyl-5-hydroxy-6-metoxy-1,4-benzoquinol methylase
MNKEKIIANIKEVKNKLDEILLELSSDQTEQKLEIISELINTKISNEIIESSEIIDKEKEFEYLKSLLQSTEWPEAVSEFQIVNDKSEEDKNDRAEGIVDLLVDVELSGKKFLDIGCGEGHIAKYASKKSSFCVGYDLTKPLSSLFDWEVESNNCILTTNFDKVIEKAPYDIIMIYDVIDHTEKEMPEELLKKAKSVLADDGEIYLRCHPWCSRHGDHLYRKINKAFIHLIFSEEEMASLGFTSDERNLKVKFPMIFYEDIINKSGLKTKSRDIETELVEDFFKTNKIVSERIKNTISLQGHVFPEHQISQCFHDYVLVK